MPIPAKATLTEAKKILITAIGAETGEPVRKARKAEREYSDDFSAAEKAWADFVYEASDYVAGTPQPAQAKMLKVFLDLPPVKDFLEAEPIWGGAVLEHLIKRVNIDLQPAVFKKFAEINLPYNYSLGETSHYTEEVFKKMDPAARSAGYDSVMRSRAFQQVAGNAREEDVIEFKAKLASLLPETDQRFLGRVWLPLDIDPAIVSNMDLTTVERSYKPVTAVCLGTKSKPEILLVGEKTIQSVCDVCGAWKERAHQIELGNDAEDSHDASGYACGGRFGTPYVVSCARLSDLFAGASDKLKDSQPKAARHLQEMARQQPFAGTRFGYEWVN